MIARVRARVRALLCALFGHDAQRGAGMEAEIAVERHGLDGHASLGNVSGVVYDVACRRCGSTLRCDVVLYGRTYERAPLSPRP